jgi:hypothetical protein
MNYSRGLFRLWLVCWALVTGYYVWLGLVAESESCEATRLAFRQECMHNKWAFLAGPIIYPPSAGPVRWQLAPSSWSSAVDLMRT